MVKLSNKLQKSKNYLFSEILKTKKLLEQQGINIADLGVGDNLFPVNPKITKALKQAVDNPKRQHYSSYNGIEEFRIAVAQKMEKRFSVNLDFKTEITALIGSKEGIFRFPNVVLNPKDIALIPNFCYPPYRTGVIEAGGKVFELKLEEKLKFLPNLEKIPTKIAEKAKLIYLNYPNNPTTAQMTEEFADKLMFFAKKYDWVILSDLAYSEMYEGEKKPFSILQFDKNKERTIEFHSFSKTYGMSGFRIGFAVGSKLLVQGLLKIKTQRGSAPFEPVQISAIEALKLDEKELLKVKKQIFENKNRIKEALKEAKIDFFKSNATFFIWAKIPKGFNSISFANHLLKLGILIIPGKTFGEKGDKYFRISSAVSKKEIDYFCKRIKQWK